MKFFHRIIFIFSFLFPSLIVSAQCSICTKTAQQLGDGPASGLNTGIIYLGLVPLLIVGFLGFRWWKNEKLQKNNE
ncbi:MAG: hypothetical protein ACK5NK_12205 [Niabella sp.]